MKRFLIYTAEGYTESPTSKYVENCQILGEVEANSKEEAIDVLFEKEFRLTSGFSKSAAIAVEIV